MTIQYIKANIFYFLKKKIDYFFLLYILYKLNMFDLRNFTKLCLTNIIKKNSNAG